MKPQVKINSIERQRINAELEAIIEEFGRAMRDANYSYIADHRSECRHDRQIPFTPHMEDAWDEYRKWCKLYGKLNGQKS